MLYCPKCGSRSGSNGKRRGQQQRQCKNDDCRHVFPAEKAATADTREAPGLHDLGNDAIVVSSPSREIPTLDAILKEFAVDMAEWKVDSWQINKWPTTVKMKVGGEEKAVQVQNYQARVKLIRVTPVKCEWPIVQGATVKPWKKRVSIKVGGGMRRAICYGDAQVGFRRDLSSGEMEPTHDVRALAVVGKMIKTLKPDHVIDLGDSLDLPDQSTKWLIKPEFARTTQDAIDWYHSWLREHRPFAGEWSWIEGNHDSRLVTNLITNMSAAYMIREANMPDEPPQLSIPKLMGLADLEIDYRGGYPNGEVYLNDHLVCRHGDLARPRPGATAQAYLNAPRASVICGHIHRQEMAHTTAHPRHGRRTYGAYLVGCCCRIDGAVPPERKNPDWSQGFAVVDFNERHFQVSLVNIWDGVAIWNGKEIRADVGA